VAVGFAAPDLFRFPQCSYSLTHMNGHGQRGRL
jgi:hypothetical protein